MKIDIWMPLYVSDYLSDTLDLTTEEHGIYFLLMLQYWKRGFLTDNIEKLLLITKLPAEKLWVLTGLLNEYFEHSEDDGKYLNKRIEEELEKAKARRQAASANGKKGGRPKKSQEKTHSFSVGKAKPNPAESSSPSPSPSHNKEINIEFEKWWDAYPKKEGKKKAKEKYISLYKNGDLPPLNNHLQIIEIWKKTKRWKEGYIKMPTTWLNGAHWSDEYPGEKKSLTTNITKATMTFDNHALEMMRDNNG